MDMKMLNSEDIHLKFLLGSYVDVDGIGQFRAPILEDIVNITEETYNMALSSIMFNRSVLDVSPEQIKDLSDFQILSSIIYHDASFRDVFIHALALHFNTIPFWHEDGFIYFEELSEETKLTEEKFYYVKKLVKIANSLQEAKEDEYKAGNERAKKFMEEQKRKKALVAKAKKPKMNLRSTISAVGWKAKSFDFISQLNIYQLYDGYHRFQLFDNFHYTMTGMYAGTLDGSKIKLEDINWANIFNT
jgi:hypothetical protein